MILGAPLANYDGVVNTADFNAFASNFNQPLAARALGARVPHPGIGGWGYCCPSPPHADSSNVRTEIDIQQIFEKHFCLSSFAITGHPR